ncbi:MAG: hypothetical protein V7K24_10115 [Nostoc sp.]
MLSAQERVLSKKVIIARAKRPAIANSTEGLKPLLLSMEKEINIYFEMRSAYLIRLCFNPLDLSMGLLSTQHSALSTPHS